MISDDHEYTMVSHIFCMFYICILFILGVVRAKKEPLIFQFQIEDI